MNTRVTSKDGLAGKSISTEPDDLSSIPGTNMVEGENGFPRKLSSDRQKCTIAREHIQRHIINKCKELFLNDIPEN